MVEKDVQSNNPNMIAPFKLDLEPLAPKVLKNRDAHIDYIKHSREYADTLREIVEHARSLKPLDRDLLCLWKPTGRTFTIIGNSCPLTRITSSKVVPLKETTSKSVTILNPEVKIYSKRTKVANSVDLSSEPSILGSRPSNISKPNKHWGSTASNSPSSSLVNFKLFSNDQIAKIMGYGDYQMGNVMISWVYYVEGLGHNLFFVGQFCDFDLEVAFWKHTCYFRDLEGVDILKGSRGSNLYMLSLEDMMLSYLICLLSKASKTKSWLWHQMLSHLNFDYITTLAKQGLVRGLPRLKFQKDHLCSTCALGKSKKHSHKPKAEDSIQEKLNLLHIDLCKPMRIQSINGWKFILVIVDDYSRFTWVKFLRSKDEVPEFMIKFIKMIQVRLNATVRNIKTDNGTEFVNQTLRAYYEDVGISHQTSVARTPQQKDTVKRRNRTLVEATRTMLIFSKAPKPDLSYLHIFGALCYPTNDSEDLGKLKPKVDIGIFVGYAPLTSMASKQFSSGPRPQLLTPGTLSTGLVPNPPSPTPYVPPTKKDWYILFQLMFDEYFNPPPSVASPVPAVVALEHADSTSTPSSTTIDQDAPSLSTYQTPQETQSPVIPSDVKEHFHDIEVTHLDNDPFFEVPSRTIF
ncbi:retrovirus-related pol polyprotein from transposon TNT 1-94 [Tanacetum coccineum]